MACEQGQGGLKFCPESERDCYKFAQSGGGGEEFGRFSPRNTVAGEAKGASEVVRGRQPQLCSGNSPAVEAGWLVGIFAVAGICHAHGN